MNQSFGVVTSAESSVTVRKNSRHTVSIEKFADKGNAIARIDGYVVFVRGGVPGDEADIRVHRTTRKYAQAEIETLRKPSLLRTEAKCRYFGSCGGCKWQHVEYEAQAAAKQRSVEEAFLHAGQVDSAATREIVPAESQYLYRNKMEFSFSANRWLTREEISSGEKFEKNFALGLHAPGQFAKVIDISECHLQSKESVQIVNLVRELAIRHEWSPWDTKRRHGLLRHLVIREGKRTGERMVNLVVSRWVDEMVQKVAEALTSSGIAVTTFVITINDTPAQTAVGDEVRVVTGSGRIRERLGDFEWQIGPQSFFQTNTSQAEKLYSIVSDFADLTGNELIYDVYCGAGTIGIFLSRQVREVVGIEVVETAVDDARTNAHLNGVENCSFVAGDVLRVLDDSFVRRFGSPDVVIVDPPRAGLHPRVARKIGNLGAHRIVYVSCNPQTQARDIAMISDRYQIDVLQPVDMFPHTDHVENVARLSAKG